MQGHGVEPGTGRIPIQRRNNRNYLAQDNDLATFLSEASSRRKCCAGQRVCQRKKWAPGWRRQLREGAVELLPHHPMHSSEKLGVMVMAEGSEEDHWPRHGIILRAFIVVLKWRARIADADTFFF